MTFNWPSLMRAAFVDLGLRPAEFWGLTPAELSLMLGYDSRVLPMGRARLCALEQAYPDGL